jgi:hypothetical protein
VPPGYRESVDARKRSTLVRWLLLASVAFGIVVMHHVMNDHPTGATMHAAVSPTAGAPMNQEPAPAPGSPHQVLHQCMDVVGPNGIAVIVLLLLIGIVTQLTPKQTAHNQAPTRAPARPPPGLAGRALLHVVCVARL